LNYRIENDKIFISLDPCEKINECMEKIAVQESIKSAWLSGIGAITDVEIGFYDPEQKEYNRQRFDGDYELTSLLGNLTMKEGSQFAHTHITFSNTDYNVFGGHLFDAKITAAGEFLMVKNEFPLHRKFNKDIGLALWCLNEE